MDTPAESTGTQRYRKWRKKKEENDPEFRDKEKERVRAWRKRKAEEMTHGQQEKRRKYEKDRKRIQRAKKLVANLDSSQANSTLTINTGNKDTTVNAEYSPYKCKQTYSKAVQKCLRSLPISPRKQKAVVMGVAKKIGLKVEDEMKKSMSVTSKEHEKANVVKEFYFRPDIVYTCPGMNDSMATWIDGKKTTLQKHYLTMFLREAFYIFKEEFRDIKIGFSSFCALRPKNVLLLKDTPSEQCKCMIHENFILKLKCVKINYDNSSWDKILCDSALNSNCWQNSCEGCKNGNKIQLPDNLAKIVTCKQWKKGEDNRITLKAEEISLGELHENLISELPEVLHHVNVKRIQANDFRNDKNSENIRILQIDFAMSYSCEYQNEVQSALWSRASVTLFTAASFSESQCKTYVICSDTKQKDKDSIFTFVTYLYEKIFEAENDQKYKEIIWSDGPSSEFKNRFMVTLLTFLSKKYNSKFEWKYFATSHGKGVIDGVGGNVKRLVNQKVRSQGDGVIIQNANDFATLAATLVPSTTISFISQSEIIEKVKKFHPWEAARPVPGISKFHQISVDEHEITCKRHALDSHSVKFSFKN